MNIAEHNEFMGGDMHDSYDHEMGSYNFWAGCKHNSHGNLYSATEKVLWEWTTGGDEPSFAWILKLKDGRFASVEGGCDYTGWDCQSSIEVLHVSRLVDDCAGYFSDDPRREYKEIFICHKCETALPKKLSSDHEHSLGENRISTK